MTMSSSSSSSSFPAVDLVPKKETGCLDFVTKYPDYNGQNVLIGILDTGIDPGASGLQYLPDGKTPKLLDIIDCTGSGDVDMTTEKVVTVIDDHTYQITTLTGKKVKLNRNWWKKKSNNDPPPSTTKEEGSATNPPLGVSSSSSKDDSAATAATAATTTTTTTTTEATNNSNTLAVTADNPNLPKVKLGIKLAYELLPQSVVNRVKAHRKREFDKSVSKYSAEIRSKLANLQQQQQQQQPESTNNSNSKGTPSPDEISKQKEDLTARMEILTDKEWNEENDPGLILDCIVFWDGEEYRAIIMSDEHHHSGNKEEEEEVHDVTNYKPLAAFHKERQYGTISTVDQYNYGVNFYDDATVLSIVGDCTPHGTHVAAICAAAAESEAEPSSRGTNASERDGVAPGAQLISFKIGDSRLSSMETGSSLVRGMMGAIQKGCDVINLSYGEGCQVPNSGRVIKCAEELVWRHNIVFVSAVGNNGPALTTANAPGGLSSCIFGVAAYVSPDMMKADYSLRSNTEKEGESNNNNNNNNNEGNDDDEEEDDDNNDDDALVGTTYTWSSVGPTADGDNGVCVCAPGGAITSVSNWTMQKSMLMNGTSMASPHACGCVALLISACKAKGIPISPSRIQRAIENTAKLMPNLGYYQQGWGMIQIEQALQHLESVKDYDTEDIYFNVTSDNSRPGNPQMRGIYLRQPEETTTKQTFSIRVNANFQRMDPPNESIQKAKINFEMKFHVKSTASWVSVPSYFMLMNNGRSFKISVDPTNLSPGVHTAKVCGYDAENEQKRGVLWSLPITVVKPLLPLNERSIKLGMWEFQPAETKRFFVVPPPGATWMDVFIKDGRDSSTCVSTTCLYVLHTVQLIPHAAYRDYEQQKYLNLTPSQSIVSSIAIESGVTCEVDIGRYWSASGIVKAEVSIEFRGVQPVPSSLSMNSGDTFKSVRLHSDLQDENISPTAKLTKWKTSIRPKAEGVISPLGERDIQPWDEKKVYQMVLTYEFNQDDKCVFTPRAPALQSVLYESVYESQLILAYDGDKKYLGVCDAYPQSITGPKGTIVLKVQIRHSDPNMLEKLKDMTIWIERKLDKEISLTAYGTREDLLSGGKAIKKRTIRKGTCASVFFSEPATSKMPSSCKTGDVLIGSVSYASGESSLPGDGKRPNGFPISYTVGPKMEKPSSSSESEVAEPKDERTPEERLQEAIRDLKVDQLGKLTGTEKEAGNFEEMYANLWKEYPSHVPLLIANLKYLDGSKKRREKLPEIVVAADKVLAQISEDELALHFGKKLDKDDPEKVKTNKEMEKKKSHLIEAMVRKAYAFADQKDDDEAGGKFDQTLKDIKAWVDIDSNGKYAALAIERDCRAGRHGAALKRINKLLSKNGKDSGGIKPLTKSDLLEKRSGIFKTLGYTVLEERDRAMKFVASPRDYKLF